MEIGVEAGNLRRVGETTMNLRQQDFGGQMLGIENAESSEIVEHARRYALRRMIGWAAMHDPVPDRRQLIGMAMRADPVQNKTCGHRVIGYRNFLHDIFARAGLRHTQR